MPAIMQVYTFTPDGRELVIHTPNLRRPWFNYLSGDAYGLRFSQTGGGFSVYPILEGRRITRYGDDDRPGRYVYVRDNATGDYWSINRQPVNRDLDRYQCRHGLGYSVIESACSGISHSLHVFVARNEPAEIWTIRIENTGHRTRYLSIFPFVEWFLGQNAAIWDAPSWYTRAAYEPDRRMISASFYNPGAGGERHDAFMRALFDVDGYCCSKRAFCGFTGSLQAPGMLSATPFAYSPAHGEETIGCLKRDLELTPGAYFEGRILLGCLTSATTERQNRFAGTDLQAVDCDQAFEDVNRFWSDLVHRHAISTPDPAFNRWINIWLKYQEYQCFRWAGLGEPNAPLMGYRDVLQHVLGMCLFAPEMARDRLVEALRHQYRNGRAVRQWSRQGNHDRRDYRDSPVWIVFALCAYLKETHDLGFLDLAVPYLDNAGEDSVLGHTLNALQALYNDRGEHGLSHLGEGDWYDPLNKAGIRGRGESVWLSMALVAALREITALFRYLKNERDADRYDGWRREVSDCINAHGWDGDWYLYGYDDDGNKIGSHGCVEGRIFANPQTWAIIAGVADPARAAACRTALEKHLKTKFGYAVVRPRFGLASSHYGNVGILQAKSRAYSHVGAFKMVADCLGGHGDDAFETFRLMDPTHPAHPPSCTQADPHIIPNGYAGVNADENHGVVLHSGSSGTFPWILKAAIEYMLGARADYDGLLIRPCLPRAWPRASVRRLFRGVVHDIVIDQSGDQVAVTVNGEALHGDLIRTNPATQQIENLPQR